jgi:hypothetical protein
MSLESAGPGLAIDQKVLHPLLLEIIIINQNQREAAETF